MKIFVPKERAPGEHRVATTPESVVKLAARSHHLLIESGAGEGSGFSDQAYREAGAEIVDASRGRAAAEALVTLGPLAGDDLEGVAEGTLVAGLLYPFKRNGDVRRMAERRLSTIAMELLPRVTRAQSMDVLSSQASIGGYKAVLLAASRLPKYFPLLMTAAGTISPARVVIMGAGVAGLQAIATAKRLGAVVEVSDIRPEVEEQVQSLGGRFIELPMEESGAGSGGYAKEMSADFLRRQREILTEHVSHADVVVTTAQVPGKKAPMLLGRDMVDAMKPGAVVVDLAAANGGNCELTRADEEVRHNGVLILGPSNLPATMPHDASLLYGRNVAALIEHITADGALALDPEDEIVAGSLVTHGGEVVHPAVATALGAKS